MNKEQLSNNDTGVQPLPSVEPSGKRERKWTGDRKLRSLTHNDIQKLLTQERTFVNNSRDTTEVEMQQKEHERTVGNLTYEKLLDGIRGGELCI